MRSQAHWIAAAQLPFKRALCAKGKLASYGAKPESRTISS